MRVQSTFAATLPPQITHQHPHDVAPKLGEAVGQSRAVRPWLVGRRSGALIALHPTTGRRFLFRFQPAAKVESNPREQGPDCQQRTGRRYQGCCPYTKLLWTQRGSAPTSLGVIRNVRAAKRRKRSRDSRGSESNTELGLVLRGQQVRSPRCSCSAIRRRERRKSPECAKKFPKKLLDSPDEWMETI